MTDDKFKLDARRLIRANIADRHERMAAVAALIDMYVDANGKAPDASIVCELSDCLLTEELTDMHVDKTTRADRPILSERQVRTRLQREAPLEYVANVTSDNVDVLFYDTEEQRGNAAIDSEVKKYRAINRQQPVTTYNLREQMGDEAFEGAYPIIPHPYATFRGKEHVDWSLDVRRRDGFTCQKCGKSNYKGMHAHHIEAYNTAIDLRHDIGNGITLCNGCHREFHAIYGLGGNTRAQLNEWMDGAYYEL